MRGEDDKVAVAEMGAVIKDLAGEEKEEKEEKDEDEEEVVLTNGVNVVTALSSHSDCRPSKSSNRTPTLDSVIVDVANKSGEGGGGSGGGEGNGSGGGEGVGGSGGGGDASSSPVRFSTSKVLFASPEPMAKLKRGERELFEDRLSGSKNDDEEEDEEEEDDKEEVAKNNGNPTTEASLNTSSSSSSSSIIIIDPNDSLLGFLLCLSRAVGSYERVTLIVLGSPASSSSSSSSSTTILSSPQGLKRNEANESSPSSLSSAASDIAAVAADSATAAVTAAVTDAGIGAMSSSDALKWSSVQVPLTALRRLVTDCFADGEQKEVSDGEMTNTNKYKQTATSVSNPYLFLLSSSKKDW